MKGSNTVQICTSHFLCWQLRSR